MTSATTRPASSTGRQVQGGGLILFASVLLLIIGCFNLIYGIAAIANSHVFAANAHYVFGSLRTWGWVTLVIGVLQLLAAAGVVAGSQLARWFAVAVLGLSAIDQMFFLPAYPLWSLVIIAVNVVALYRLCVYGSRANLAARRISARAGRSCDMEASMLHRTAPAERDRNSGPRRHSPAPPQTTQAGAQADRQPGFGWTLVLRRQRPASWTASHKAATPMRSSSSAATAGTIPTWIITTSPRGFSRSAGPIPSQSASPHTSSMHGATGGRRLRPGESSAADDAADAAGSAGWPGTPRRPGGGSAGHPDHRRHDQAHPRGPAGTCHAGHPAAAEGGSGDRLSAGDPVWL